MIYLGDGLDMLASMPAGSVDMILVDTPYKTTKSRVDKKRLDLDRMWVESRRVIKRHGAIVHFSKDKYTALLMSSHLKGYKHKWVWEKNQGGNFAVTRYMPYSVDEDILVFTAHGERVTYYPQFEPCERRTRSASRSANNGRGFGGLKGVAQDTTHRHPRSVLKYPTVNRSKSRGPHEKPVALLMYLINTYSKPGELVVDFTMGTGSTGEAAHNTGRKFAGAELDYETYKIAEERLYAIGLHS